jgi:hypothetical protein
VKDGGRFVNVSALLFDGENNAGKGHHGAGSRARSKFQELLFAHHAADCAAMEAAVMQSIDSALGESAGAVGVGADAGAGPGAGTTARPLHGAQATPTPHTAHFVPHSPTTSLSSHASHPHDSASASASGPEVPAGGGTGSAPTAVAELPIKKLREAILLADPDKTRVEVNYLLSKGTGCPMEEVLMKEAKRMSVPVEEFKSNLKGCLLKKSVPLAPKKKRV